jgi:hypothetical protein
VQTPIFPETKLRSCCQSGLRKGPHPSILRSLSLSSAWETRSVRFNSRSGSPHRAWPSRLARPAAGSGRGGFVALLGPWGFGKTSLLRCIGFLFQSHALFPDMTVEENVRFGLDCRGVPRAEAAARAGASLERVGFGGMARRYPRQLSGCHPLGQPAGLRRAADSRRRTGGRSFGAGRMNPLHVRVVKPDPTATSLLVSRRFGGAFSFFRGAGEAFRPVDQRPPDRGPGMATPDLAPH